MAKQERGGRSHGPKAVGLMALHDKDFFARLLNPKEARTAMKEKAEELGLTEADMDQVEKLIEERNRARPGVDALKLWDRYNATGFWDPGDWPITDDPWW